MKRLTILLAVLAVFLWVPCSYATVITVGGGLGDWGITSPTGFHATETVDNPVLGKAGDIYYWEEDAVAGGGRVGPAWGGQDFDLEGLYYTTDSGKSYIAAIVGGMPQGGVTSGGTEYFLGDVFLYTDTGLFAIQTTGSGAGTFGKVDSTIAASYAVSSSPAQVALFMSGTERDLGSSFDYYLTAWGTDHYILEMGFDTSLIGDISKIHLTQTCGNDVADLPVPEPATMLLLGTGLIGLAAIGRKRLVKKG